MTISEIKKWAKDKGYTIVKDKDDGKYYWAKLGDNDPTASGIESSVSKVAKAVFNHLTNNKWIDHQIKYKENLEAKRISLTDYGT